jgi:hypothetical protein
MPFLGEERERVLDDFCWMKQRRLDDFSLETLRFYRWIWESIDLGSNVFWYEKQKHVDELTKKNGRYVIVACSSKKIKIWFCLSCVITSKKAFRRSKLYRVTAFMFVMLHFMSTGHVLPSNIFPLKTVESVMCLLQIELILNLYLTAVIARKIKSK